MVIIFYLRGCEIQAITIEEAFHDTFYRINVLPTGKRVHQASCHFLETQSELNLKKKKLQYVVESHCHSALQVFILYCKSQYKREEMSPYSVVSRCKNPHKNHGIHLMYSAKPGLTSSHTRQLYCINWR